MHILLHTLQVRNGLVRRVVLRDVLLCPSAATAFDAINWKDLLIREERWTLSLLTLADSDPDDGGLWASRRLDPAEAGQFVLGLEV